MRYRYLILTLGLVCFTCFSFLSQAEEIKGTDPSSAQPPRGLGRDQTNNPNPAISTPSPEAKSGSNSTDQNSTAPQAVRIQEGTNAED